MRRTIPLLLGGALAATLALSAGVAAADPGPKVTICHWANGNPHTITVSINAAGGHFYVNSLGEVDGDRPAPGHERDYLGSCEAPSPTETSVSPSPSGSESPSSTPSETETTQQSQPPTESPSPSGSESPSPTPSETETTGQSPSETESPLPSESESPSPSETEASESPSSHETSPSPSQGSGSTPASSPVRRSESPAAGTPTSGKGQSSEARRSATGGLPGASTPTHTPENRERPDRLPQTGGYVGGWVLLALAAVLAAGIVMIGAKRDQDS